MFLFRLEPVLKHRKHLEELIQKDLAQLQLQLDELHRSLHRVKNDMCRCSEEIHRLQREGVTISEQLTYSQYVDTLKFNKKRIEMEILRLQQKLEEKRLELMEAVKRRKTIEKLKEKGNLAYLDELLKAEQKLLDEAAVCRYKFGSAAVAG